MEDDFPGRLATPPLHHVLQGARGILELCGLATIFGAYL